VSAHAVAAGMLNGKHLCTYEAAKVQFNTVAAEHSIANNVCLSFNKLIMTFTMHWDQV
jgi:hypothetical protein